MKRNTVAITEQGIIINDVNYGELGQFTVDGHTIFTDSWRLTSRGYGHIFGECTTPNAEDLERLNTVWYASIGAGSVGSVYIPVGGDMEAVCQQISQRAGVSSVIANSRVLLRCENGVEKSRATLDDYYTDVTDEEREATQFF